MVNFEQVNAGWDNVRRHSCFSFHKVDKIYEKKQKIELPKYSIWKITFIHNFHQQEKFLESPTLFHAQESGHKSSHRVLGLNSNKIYSYLERCAAPFA